LWSKEKGGATPAQSEKKRDEGRGSGKGGGKDFRRERPEDEKGEGESFLYERVSFEKNRSSKREQNRGMKGRGLHKEKSLKKEAKRGRLFISSKVRGETTEKEPDGGGGRPKAKDPGTEDHFVEGED